MKKLILHLGQYKTGSTSIQKYLSGARKALLERGICYPATFAREGAHFLISDGLKAEFNGKGNFDLTPLLREVADSGAHVVVISNEAMSSATVKNFRPRMIRYVWERLAKAFSDFDVQVIFYVRRQDESIESRIVQEIKGQSRGTNLSHVPYLKNESSLDYAKFSRMAEGVFGKGCVRARLFDRRYLADGDVRSDFLDCLELPKKSLPEFSAEQNISPSGKCLAFLRMLNSLEAPGNVLAPAYKASWKSFNGPGSEKCIVLDAESRRQVMSYFKQSNEAFIAEFIPVRERKHFSDVLLGAERNAVPNVWIDGYEALQFIRKKGLEISLKSAGAKA